jgi:nucleotide-binding universal stress UspA family protein
MGTDVELVLVAVDSSDQSREAAEYAVAVAERYGADLHLLHFLDHQVMRGIETGDLPADTVAETQQSVTDDIRELLPEDGSVGFAYSGVAGFSTTRLGQTPGSVVLDVAEELDTDFLVVPRETPSTPDEVIGKAALHILEYARQPVLSV